MTLVEADVHGVLLVRSALAHADAVARAVSARHPFLPSSIGRIVVEHSLRARTLLDNEATPTERAERRLDDLLYAVTEAERQRNGFARRSGGDADSLDDASDMLQTVEARAATLGFKVTRTKTGGRRVSESGRPSTMSLAERYLGGEYPGVLEFLVRSHGASVHGVETALLDAAIDQFDPSTGINMPQPALMPAPLLSFALMGIPLATIGTLDALAARFEWPRDTKPGRGFDRDRSRLFQTWAAAANAAEVDTAQTAAARGVHSNPE